MLRPSSRYCLGSLIVSAAYLMLSWVAGCLEIQTLVGGTLGTPAGMSEDIPDTNGEPGEGNGSQPDGLPLVQISASNTTPQLNEQVTLFCNLVRGSSEGLMYSFQPDLQRLTIDERRGTADFIVQESDLGVSLNFTCSAMNSIGLGPRSLPIVVTSSGPTGP